MANLTRDDVLKLAQLARIDLSEAELTEFTQEFNEILRYVEQLQSADTAGLEPTYQVSGLTNVMRDDMVVDYGYEPKELLKNVPETDADQIKTKRILG